MRHAKESEGGAVRFADGESPAPSRCKAASLLLHKTGAEQQQHGGHTQEAAPRYYKTKFTEGFSVYKIPNRLSGREGEMLEIYQGKN